MKLYLNDNSVCSLVELMKEAIEEDNLGVALFLSKEVHDKLSDMVLHRKKIDCKMKEEKK